MFVQLCFSIVLFISTSIQSIHAQTDAQIVAKLQTLSEEIKTLQQSIAHNPTTSAKPTISNLQKHILHNIKKEVGLSWKKVASIVEYFKHIANTYNQLQENSHIQKIFIHQLILSILMIIASYILGKIITHIIYKTIHTTRLFSSGIFYLTTWIIYLLLLSVTPHINNINHIFSLLFFGITITQYCKILLYSLISYYLHNIPARIIKNIIFFLTMAVYITLSTYIGYFWILIFNNITADYYAMVQIQGIAWSCLTIWLILYIKDDVNHLLMKSLIGTKSTLLSNILLMWHWFSILIMFLLIASWTIHTTKLAYIFNIIFTIITIPTFSLCLKSLKTMLLLRIRQHTYTEKMILYGLYLRSKKYLSFITITLYILLINWIWNIQSVSVLRKILTDNIANTLFLLSSIFLLYKAFQFLLNYVICIKYALLYKNREQLIKLIKIVSHSVLTLIFFLITVSLLGYDPMPYINSLGFLSFGLSIGAQTIIKDMFSGFLLIFDKTISIGDTVTFDNQQGVVEELSLCTAKFRLENGTLLTVQYGELKSIGNKNKNYCYAVINTAVEYQTDPEQVTALIEKAFQIIKQSSAGNRILAPIEIRGIDHISGHEMIIQSRIKTIPRAENSIIRLFNLHIKKLFDQAGIKISNPRTLNIPT